MKISQISHDKVLISLCSDDMKNFDLDFYDMGFSDPHSKKILSRLLSLACTSNSIPTDNKKILCEALKSGDGCVLLVSLSDKKERTKYRIKRIKEYPCYKFTDTENMLTTIEKLYNTDTLYYNNSAYLYNDSYYLVFDYPLVPKKAKEVLSEFAKKVKGSKTFIARLSESGKTISSGNAIVTIGASL